MKSQKDFLGKSQQILLIRCEKTTNEQNRPCIDFAVIDA
jgi:hypothetical protein